MKKKLLVLLAVLTLVVCMLVSCGECEHETVGEDGKCTECGEQIEDPTPDPEPEPEPEPEHEGVDANRDFVCDDPGCGETVVPPTPDRTGKTYDWESANLKIQMNLASSGNELDATSKRYMAGDASASKNAKIDTAVADRNYDMFNTTKISMAYQYIDDKANYLNETQGWGNYYRRAIAKDRSTYVEGETADMYCGFAFDLTMASALGYFHNLKAESINGTAVKNYFTFLLDDYRPQFDQEGYIYEFMQDLSPIPESKMYLVASNFTLDVIRSIYCIPVSVGLLESLDIDDLPEGSDADGDGKYEINEFYAMVRNMDWTYDMLAELSAAAYDPTSGEADANLNDVLGFALDNYTGLPRLGFNFSVDFNWYNMEMKEGVPEYTVNADATDALYDIITAWESFFNKPGVIKLATTPVDGVTKEDAYWQMGAESNLLGIRERFSLDKILFGGVLVLGALDYDAYQNMENGFGIAPIPLYKADENSQYTSAIHNLARVIGILDKVSADRFSKCTAYLDFQSLNSDEIRDLYNRSLNYDTGLGDEYNIEMIEYLVDHIRNNRDQYIENMMNRSDVLEDNIPDAKYKFGNFLQNQTSATVRKWFGDAEVPKAEALQHLVAKFVALP